ncbi:hypothetical protein [Algoriphagus resistens]|uniref:hypothetical protein n=1 Tax=Algoriphagus resistens TaxID=1750590 RepID=UPI000716B1F6|nr:hypothetical protein [Algoriphagus resistens]
MKTTLVLVVLSMEMALLFLGGLNGQAQTMGEWLKPKKTQIEYLVKHVVLLRTFRASVKESGNILGAGLDLIGESKDGEYSRHTQFFDKLKVPGPLTRDVLLEMEKQGLHPTELKQVLMESRRYWRTKTKWDHPRLFQWSDRVLEGMIQRADEQQVYFELLTSKQGLQMEDYERAVSVLDIMDQLIQLKKDLLLVHEKGHRYLQYYTLNLN